MGRKNIYLFAIYTMLIGMLMSVSSSIYAQTDERINSQQAGEWLIDPATNVGLITPSSTEEDLKMIYGEENVVRTEIYLNDGTKVIGTRILGGTDKALDIGWKGDFKNPKLIIISGESKAWKLADGIKVGTSLGEIEKVNGRPFTLTGFEHKEPLHSVSWGDGKLPRQLEVSFERPDDLLQQEYKLGTEGDNLNSEGEMIKKMGLVVKKIFIRW